MTRRGVEAVVQSLNEAGVRYLVVGGVAVVAHGYVRFTADLDLVLDPKPEALRRAVIALSAISYRPRAPVAFEDFADETKRLAWAAEKGLTVFSIRSDVHSGTEVDLFAESPFDFEAAYSRCSRFDVSEGIVATVLGLSDLINMKRKAGRPLDMIDLAALEAQRDEMSPDDA